jgi:hypothetical protein
MVRRAVTHPIIWLGLAALSVTPSLAEEPAKSNGWPFAEEKPKDLSAVVGEVKDAVKDPQTPSGIEGESDFGSPTYGGGDGVGRKSPRGDLDKIFNASLEGFDGTMQKAQREAGASGGGGMPIPTGSTGSMGSMGGMPGTMGSQGGMAGQPGMPGGMPGQPGAEPGYPTDGGLADSQPPMPNRKSGSDGQSGEQSGEQGSQGSDGSAQTASTSGGGDMASGPGTNKRKGAGDKGDNSVAEAEKLPDDVPKGDAPNAVVARQIREAALKETDPVLREKLWEEYRKLSRGS